MKPTLEIDGTRFETLEGFYDEVSRRLIPGSYWGRNLDAFNDILRGGFGTPEGGFILIWRHHGRSRAALDHAETARQLRLGLEDCHPANTSDVKARLEAALRGEGPTVFDWIVAIIRSHGDGGVEAKDGVELRLL